MRVGEPVIVEDMATETRFDTSSTMLKPGVVSSLSVPIKGQHRRFGVLSIHAYEPRRFSEDEVEFLTAISTLVIVAVERDGEEQATRHAALHDPLTGLPNRTLALDRLAYALARRRREGIDVAVLMLDLNRFKIINDSLGHAAGDAVLSRVGAPARRRGPPNRHGRAPGRGRVRGHLPRRRRRPRRHRDRQTPHGRGKPSAGPQQRRAFLHGQHRHHARLLGRGHSRVAAARRRRRHVPGKGARTRTPRDLRRSDANQRHGAGPDRDGTSPGARRRRAHRLVPAGDRPCDRPGGLHRGARALGTPRTRPDRPPGLHPDRRGDRLDRRTRTAGPGAGLPADRGLAAATSTSRSASRSMSRDDR